MLQKSVTLNPERSLPKLQLSSPKYETKTAKKAKEEFFQMRKLTERKRTEELKKIEKRYEYGDTAEKEYIKNKVKTEPSKYDEMDKMRVK